MEEICRNCKNFVQRTQDSGRYLSACQKHTNEDVVLKWVNETCSDFEPIREKQSACSTDDPA